MPKFGVSLEKEAALVAQMAELGVREEDLDESFIKGGGPGGQKINKTASCVQLRHRPSGIEVRCQESRSQALNRFVARRILCQRLSEKIFGKESAEQQAREKIRRQKRRRSRRAKQKLLADKRQRAGVKVTRRAVRRED